MGAANRLCSSRLDAQGEDADGLLREMIRQVHPDRQTTEKTYTAEEVTAMLNSVREVL